MSIYLIRHGETPLNVARVLQPPDTPLSERGVAQARALARRLLPLGLAGIVSSDVPRAAQTAAAVAALTGLPVRHTVLLRERDYGELRGQPYDGLGFDPLTMEEAPPGGESRAVFNARVAQAFAHLIALRIELGGPLAAITHGLVIREIQNRHVQCHTGGSPLRIGNTAVTCFEVLAPHRTTLVNCVAHLDTTQADAVQSLSGG